MTYFPNFHTVAFNTEEERLAAANLPLSDRQRMVSNLLFPYKQFNDVTAGISSFHIPVKASGMADTGRIGAVLGESRAGKSYILKCYAQSRVPVVGENGLSFPVIYIEARAEWDSCEFARQIFFATGKNHVPRISVAALNTLAVRRISDFGTRLVIVDDAHFLFAGHPKRRGVFTALLKSIADQDCCNVILAGLPNVETAVRSEPQLWGRGGFPTFHVRRFNPATREGKESFRLFLAGVDKRLPFAQLSELGSAQYAKDFRQASNGSVGMIMNIVRSAALKALDAGTSRLMPAHLRAAAEEQRASNDNTISFAGEDFRDDGSLYA